MHDVEWIGVMLSRAVVMSWCEACRRDLAGGSIVPVEENYRFWVRHVQEH